jgi:transcription antitermination factor NusG
MKIGDLVKVKRSPFHSWNGVIIGWYFEQREVFVLENKWGTSHVTVPFDPKTMEIVNEDR